MRTQEEYELSWKQHGDSSRGPVDWRRAHHGMPDVAMAALCGEADRRGLHVRLTVERGEQPREFLNDSGEKIFEYRLLHRLTVNQADQPLVIVDVGRAGGLPSAARRALEHLEQLEAA